jgi:hypothetical protein
VAVLPTIGHSDLKDGCPWWMQDAAVSDTSAVASEMNDDCCELM